jgi:hypothetical protein
MLFDEIYRHHQHEEVTIVKTNNLHHGKIIYDKQAVNNPVKSDDLFNEWWPAVDPGKATYLKEMIADFKAAGLINEYASEDFIYAFEEVKDEAETVEKIQESGFIPAALIDAGGKCVELHAYVFYQPFKFDVMFNTYFVPLLSEKGITDIIVEQETHQTGDDDFTYHVQIRSSDAAWEFREHGMQDLIRPFVLAINRILTEKSITERFVRVIEFDMGFLFCEPNQIVPCLSKYNFRVKAVDLYE